MEDLSQDLIRLDPDDEPAAFYRKLFFLPDRRLDETVARFDGYKKYANLLRFHRLATRRPDANVRLTYNARHGWHASSCMRSLPEFSPEKLGGYREPCNCERDFLRPEAFFRNLEEEVKAKNRCKLCKRNLPYRSSYATAGESDGGGKEDEREREWEVAGGER